MGPCKKFQTNSIYKFVGSSKCVTCGYTEAKHNTKSKKKSVHFEKTEKPRKSSSSKRLSVKDRVEKLNKEVKRFTPKAPRRSRTRSPVRRYKPRPPPPRRARTKSPVRRTSTKESSRSKSSSPSSKSISKRKSKELRQSLKTPERISIFLASHKLGKYSEKMKRRRVTNVEKAKKLNVDDFRSIGLPKDDARKLFKILREMDAPSRWDCGKCGKTRIRFSKKCCPVCNNAAPTHSKYLRQVSSLRIQRAWRIHSAKRDLYERTVDESDIPYIPKNKPLSVAQALCIIDMEKYVPIFFANDILSLRKAARLTTSDLSRMNIKGPDNRKIHKTLAQGWIKEQDRLERLKKSKHSHHHHRSKHHHKSKNHKTRYISGYSSTSSEEAYMSSSSAPHKRHSKEEHKIVTRRRRSSITGYSFNKHNKPIVDNGSGNKRQSRRFISLSFGR